MSYSKWQKQEFPKIIRHNKASNVLSQWVHIRIIIGRLKTINIPFKHDQTIRNNIGTIAI